MKDKRALRIRRKKTVRRKVTGTAERPRLSVYRSNKHIYAQLIDDIAGKSLVTSSDKAIKKGTPVERAIEVGKEIATKAKTMKINQVVFDRSGYKYHGRVKSLADGAREAGLEF